MGCHRSQFLFRVLVFWLSAFLVSGSPLALDASARTSGPQSPQRVSKKTVRTEFRKLQKGTWKRRESVAFRLASFGAGALPELARELGSERGAETDGYGSRLRSAYLRIALADEESLPILVQHLGNKHPAISAAAWKGLTYHGDAAIDPVAELVAHEHAHVRTGAVTALAFLGRESDRCQPLFIEGLKNDEHSRVRWRSAWALGLHEALDDAAIGALEAALEDKSDDVAFYAVWALGRQGSRGLNGLLAALDRPSLREQAATRVAFLGEAALDSVVARLRPDTNRFELVQLVRIAGVIGLHDESCRTAILSLLRHESPAVRAEVALLVPDIVDELEYQLDYLGRALASESEAEREAACAAAGRLGARAKPLALTVLRCWAFALAAGQDSAPYEHALLDIGITTPEEVDFLFMLLESQSPLQTITESPSFASVMRVLTSCAEFSAPRIANRVDNVEGPNAQFYLSGYAQLMAGLNDEFLPSVIALTRSDSEVVRAAALGALGEFESELDVRVEVLREAWRDERNRAAVARALRRIGEDDGGLRRAALEQFEELDYLTRARLLKAMGLWDPDAPGLVGKLRALALESPLAGLRQTACAVLPHGDEQQGRRSETLIEVLELQGSPRVRKNPSFMLGSDSPDDVMRVQESALLALGMLGHANSHVLAALTQFLSSPEMKLRMMAAESIEALGLQAADVAPELAAAYFDSEGFVQFVAVRATRALGPEGQSVLAQLGDVLMTADGEVAHLAIRAIEAFGAQARLIVPQLLVALVDERWSQVSWRRSEIDGRNSSGLWQPYRVPDSFRETRAHAATLLGEIGATSAEDAELIRPFLARAASDADPELATAARAAIDRLTRTGADGE